MNKQELLFDAKAAEAVMQAAREINNKMRDIEESITKNMTPVQRKLYLRALLLSAAANIAEKEYQASMKRTA